MSQRYEGSGKANTSNNLGTSDYQSTSGTSTARSTSSNPSELASEAKHKVQDLGKMAKDVANETMDNLRGNASEYVERGRTVLRDFEGQFVRQVRTNPVKSLLIAAGAGLALGFVLKSSK